MQWEKQMSRAAFAMLMAAAVKQFKAAFETEEMDAIQSALEDMKRLDRMYYDHDLFCTSASPSERAA